jgi:metacaspase-1
MKKKALLVGINYRGTSHELEGCINDLHNMNAFLLECGFDDIRLLQEAEATTDNIIEELRWLTTDVDSGDVILFHYSGHGSQLPSKSESDGFEEIICPVDLDWGTKVITDDTLRSIFGAVPNGVNTTVILDCCHSGTMLDQIESLNLSTVALEEKSTNTKHGSRYLKPPAKITKKLKNRSLVNWSTSRDVNESALLIAGCQADQTSADAVIDGQAQGAATASLLKILKANKNISYRTLVTEMNKFMATNGFTQQPDLDGSSSLYDQTFIQPYIVSPLVQISNGEFPVIIDGAPHFDLEFSLKALALVGTIIVILIYILLPH